jgi:large subunit ribosomal protein L13
MGFPFCGGVNAPGFPGEGSGSTPGPKEDARPVPVREVAIHEQRRGSQEQAWSVRTAAFSLYRVTLMKTFSAKPAEVVHEWFVIDATDKVLGRVASEVALRLRGKHKPIYTPHVDTGDFIVIVNADKIRVTGNKAEQKTYYRHSGYPGGIYATKFKDMQAKHPGRAIEKAVKGMLPKGPLGYAMIKKLKVYAGGTHPHAAQQPKALEI